MYKIHNENGDIQRSDGAVIPPDKKNRDWRKYQQWLAEGNEPEPMDIIDPWIAKRQERYLILQSCDWTNTIDGRKRLSPEKARVGCIYRQALADLPETYPNANDIVWPTEPE